MIELFAGFIGLLMILCFFGMYSRLGEIRERLDRSIELQAELVEESKRGVRIAEVGPEEFKRQEEQRRARLAAENLTHREGMVPTGVAVGILAIVVCAGLVYYFMNR